MQNNDINKLEKVFIDENSEPFKMWIAKDLWRSCGKRISEFDEEIWKV